MGIISSKQWLHWTTTLQLYITLPLRMWGKPDLSPRFITQILRADGTLNNKVSVTKVEQDKSNLAGGAVGDMTRLRLTYSEDSPHAPATLVVKQIKNQPRSYLNSIFCGFWREAKAYHALVKHEALPIPHVYHADSNSWTGEMALFLEDLLGTHTLTAFLLGNQFKGEKPVTWPKNVQDLSRADVVNTTFVTAAKLHGHFWNHPDLETIPGLKMRNYYKGKDRYKFEASRKVVLDIWTGIRKKLTTSKDYRINPEVVDAIDRSFENCTWEQFQTDVKNAKFHTLVHGDWHAQNFFTSHQDPSQVKVVDWTEASYGSFPCTDIGQMVVSDVRTELRRQHEYDWLKAYVAELENQGVKDFGFDEALEQYRVGGLEKWITLFPYMPLFMPPVGVQFFHDQIEGFLEDHQKELKARGEPVAYNYPLRAFFVFIG